MGNMMHTAQNGGILNVISTDVVIIRLSYCRKSVMRMKGYIVRVAASGGSIGPA